MTKLNVFPENCDNRLYDCSDHHDGVSPKRVDAHLSKPACGSVNARHGHEKLPKPYKNERAVKG